MLSSLGPIYKIHRRKYLKNQLSNGQNGNKLKTLEGITKDINMKISKLSDFENGKIQLDESVVCELYKRIGIEYRNNKCEGSNFQKSFYTFYGHVLSYEDYTESYQNLKQNLDTIRCTPYYPQYLLAELMYDIYVGNISFDQKEKIEMLESLFDYLDENQKQIYYDTIGVYYKNIGLYDNALSCFDKASIYGYIPATAMMYYHKTMILLDIGNLSEAMDTIKLAKESFDKDVRFRRSLLCNCTMAKIYVRLGAYDKGIYLYEQCLEYLKSLSLEDDLLITLNNISWTYMLKKEYKSALTASDQTLELCHNHAPSYFFKAFCYHELGNDGDAKRAIKKAKECLKTYKCTRYMKAMIQAYSFILSDKKSSDDKIKRLDLALKEAEKCCDFQIELFVMKLLIEQYVGLNDRENIIFYQNKVIEIYEKRK